MLLSSQILDAKCSAHFVGNRIVSVRSFLRCLPAVAAIGQNIRTILVCILFRVRHLINISLDSLSYYKTKPAVFFLSRIMQIHFLFVLAALWTWMVGRFVFPTLIRPQSFCIGSSFLACTNTYVLLILFTAFIFPARQYLHLSYTFGI